MEELTPRTIAEVTRGDWLPLGVGAERRCPDPPVGRVCRSVFTDSRAPERDGLFVPIVGERFDGHDFIPDVTSAGTSASLVSTACVRDVLARLRASGHDPYCDLIVVDDTLRALVRLARWYRSRLDARVVAVTGSYGKTTVKDFSGRILERGFETVRAQKSFNNHLGVALTVLSASRSTRFLVVELGTNAPGEIAELVDVVRPDIGIATGVAAAHLEGLGDMAGVVREKSDLFAGIASGGTALLPSGIAGEEIFLEKARASGAATWRYGWPAPVASPQYEITRCELLSRAGRESRPGYLFELNHRHLFELPVPGRHNVFNATAAITVGREVGLDWQSLQDGVRNLTLPPLRLQVEQANGIVVVNDTYNSNPASVGAALRAVDDLPLRNGGRWFIVLGDMLELGSSSELIHSRLGNEIACRGTFSALWTIGPIARTASASALAGGLESEAFELGERERLVEVLAETLRPGDGVLFKASRGVALDRVVESFRDHIEPDSRGGASRQEVSDACLAL